MMVRVSLFFSLLILCIPVFSQTVLRGKAVDDKTHSGIGFVTVSLFSLKDTALMQGQVSDSAGVFQFSQISAGTYLLRLSTLGYKETWKPAATGDIGNILMTADASLLEEVVVAGGRPAIQRMADRIVLNVSGNKLFTASANTFDILKKVPGLEVNGDGTITMSGRISPGVFIDGKPVLMNAEELQQYLTSLSPEMISSIEVINNPSSRYDGEYKGIIDIKLKRDQTLGWKGNVLLSLQQNERTLSDNNFQLSYKTKKVAYTARIGYTIGSRPYRYGALQHQANTNIMTTRTKTITHNDNLSYQLGAEYSISKGQRIDVGLRVFQLNRDVDAFNTLFTTDSSRKRIVFHTNSINISAPQQRNYAANLNYTAQFGEHQLDVLGAIAKVSNRQDEDIQNREAETLLDYWKTYLKNDILIRMAQADLSLQVWKGKIGAGAKFAYTTTKNDLRYDTLLSNHTFGLDSSRTNNFQYDEYISAAYVSYERTWRKWSYTLSLRAEHTHSVAENITRDYMNWLPGFIFSYNSQWHLSYSRRMTRPNFQQLNPFRFYLSPLNFVVGNPQLQPSRTNTLNLGYSHKAFNVAVQIGRELSPMARYPEYDSASNELQYLGRNLPYGDFAGIELSFPLSPKPWWRMQHTFRAGYRKEQTPYHGIIYSIPITDYNISGSQVFTLPHAITVDLSYYYKSRSGNGIYRIMPLGNIDLSLQKSWLKGKLNARISYYDILDTYRVFYIFREKQILNNELSHWFGNRRVVATLNYSFGKSTHKGKQNSKNEEENRAGM